MVLSVLKKPFQFYLEWLKANRSKEWPSNAKNRRSLDRPILYRSLTFIRIRWVIFFFCSISTSPLNHKISFFANNLFFLENTYWFAGFIEKNISKKNESIKKPSPITKYWKIILPIFCFLRNYLNFMKSFVYSFFTYVFFSIDLTSSQHILSTDIEVDLIFIYLMVCRTNSI